MCKEKMFRKVSNGGEEVNCSIDLDRNIAIIDNDYFARTTLLNSIIERIIKCDKEIEVYIISDLKEELKFDSEKVKAYVQGTHDALNVLKRICTECTESENHKTIIVHNLHKFMGENEEIEKIILSLFKVGRARKINMIITNDYEEDIRLEDILCNSHIHFMGKGNGTFEMKLMGMYQGVVFHKYLNDSGIVGDPKGIK